MFSSRNMGVGRTSGVVEKKRKKGKKLGGVGGREGGYPT